MLVIVDVLLPPWSRIGPKKVLIGICTFDHRWSEGLGLLTSIVYLHSVGDHVSEFSQKCEVVHTIDHILREWPHVRPPRGVTVVSWWFGESYDLISVYMRTPWIQVTIVGNPSFFFSSDLPGSLPGEHWFGRCELHENILSRERSTTVFLDQQPIQVVQMLISQSNHQLSCACRSADTDSTFCCRIQSSPDDKT